MREIHRRPGEFPTQMANNPENVSIWLRHHVQSLVPLELIYSHLLTTHIANRNPHSSSSNYSYCCLNTLEICRLTSETDGEIIRLMSYVWWGQNPNFVNFYSKYMITKILRVFVVGIWLHFIHSLTLDISSLWPLLGMPPIILSQFWSRCNSFLIRYTQISYMGTRAWVDLSKWITLVYSYK